MKKQIHIAIIALLLCIESAFLPLWGQEENLDSEVSSSPDVQKEEENDFGYAYLLKRFNKDNEKDYPPSLLTNPLTPIADDYSCPPRKTTNFTGRLTAFQISSETIPDYLSQEGVDLAYKMAQGKYDDVIAEAQKNIKECCAWWEDKNNYGVLGEMQRLLANAYELKGDWDNALLAYRSYLGSQSVDFMWVQYRLLFLRYENFFYDAVISEAQRLREQEGDNPQRIAEMIKKGEADFYALRPSVGDRRGFMISNELHHSWQRLWKFRDRCVRALCPEIYYVTSLTPYDGVESFSELQEKTFLSLVDRVEKHMESQRVNYGLPSYEDDVKFLRFLASLPFDMSPDGLYYEKELYGGRTGAARVPIARPDSQPFIMEED